MQMLGGFAQHSLEEFAPMSFSQRSQGPRSLGIEAVPEALARLASGYTCKRFPLSVFHAEPRAQEAICGLPMLRGLSARCSNHFFRCPEAVAA